MHAVGDCFGTNRELASDEFEEQLDPTGMRAREISMEADRTQAIWVLYDCRDSTHASVREISVEKKLVG